MRAIKNILTVSIPSLLLLFVVLEVFFRFAIPGAAKPIAYFDEQNLMLRSHESRRTTGLYTLGRFAEIRSHWRTNNYGWNSSIDYSPEPDPAGRKLVGIIGDSYIRGLQVDVDKTTAALLREDLSGDHQIYSFGHDGAPLSQYLHMSRYVNRNFDPDILIFVLIHNDFDESLAELAHKPYFMQLSLNGEEPVEIQPVNTNLYQFLTYSATFRYLYSNLVLSRLIFRLIEDAGNSDDFNANVDVASLNERRASMRKAAEYLMTKIEDENAGRRVIFAMHAPVNDIYNDKLETSSVRWINEMVRDICVDYALECADLSQTMNEDYQKHGQEFLIPGDGHWNEYGHRVVSDFLRQQIVSAPTNMDTTDPF